MDKLKIVFSNSLIILREIDQTLKKLEAILLTLNLMHKLSATCSLRHL